MLSGGLVMTLIRYKLGQLIEQSDTRNRDNSYSINDVRGISTGKEFIETKANLNGVSLNSYKIVKKGEFSYVSDTSRRGDKIAIAFNTNDKNIIISSIYTVFYVKKCDILLPNFLFIFFNRPEFDRYSRFNSWGSARETFSWDDMCDIDIDLPSIEIQQKYVNIYNSFIKNQQCFEQSLKDLKLVCDAYLEELKKKSSIKYLGDYIENVTKKNEDLFYGEDSVRGISINKEFIYTKANMKGVSLKPYLLIAPNEFAYVTVTSRNGDKISIARNNSKDTFICSSSYVVFKITDTTKLLPEFLSLFFSQSNFDRYARYNSWGSARETFEWNDMCDVKISIPDIKSQHYLVELFNTYCIRKEINEKLKAQIKYICPILVKGSIEEASKGA